MTAALHFLAACGLLGGLVLWVTAVWQFVRNNWHWKAYMAWACAGFLVCIAASLFKLLLVNDGFELRMRLRNPQASAGSAGTSAEIRRNPQTWAVGLLVKPNFLRGVSAGVGLGTPNAGLGCGLGRIPPLGGYTPKHPCRSVDQGA